MASLSPTSHVKQVLSGWFSLSSRMIGASAAIAWVGFTITGSGSYSTLIASQPSLAM